MDSAHSFISSKVWICVTINELFSPGMLVY